MVSKEAVEIFIDQKNHLKPKRPTAFLFYSEMGFTDEQEALMRANGIMYTTYEKLAGSLFREGP